MNTDDQKNGMEPTSGNQFDAMAGLLAPESRALRNVLVFGELTKRNPTAKEMKALAFIQIDAPRVAIFVTIPVNIFAIVTGFWYVVHVATHHSVVGALVTLLFLFGISRLGRAPVAVVASSLLHFSEGAVGLWLPIVTYALAAISLPYDVRLVAARRTVKRALERPLLAPVGVASTDGSSTDG
jgi:hypothetical protein